MLKGIAASNGIAIAKVYKLKQPELNITKTTADPEQEIKRLESAIEHTVKDIEQIKEAAAGKLKEEELAIYDAHLMMIQDPEYKNQIVDMIQSEKVNADYACDQVSKNMIALFESMEDDYMRQRASDIRDVSFRLLCHLQGKEIPNLATLHEAVIIVAEDLTPSDTGSLNKEYAKGFVTEMGGRTSHSAIMARSLEIPAIVGVKGVLDQVEDGQVIIMDAIKGEVILHPSEDEIKDYTKKQEEYIEEKKSLDAFIDKPSVSRDGRQVLIVGNTGSPADVEGVLNYGGEGVGLFRTEFLYMKSESNFPDEETQFAAYRQVLESMKDRPVVIRTLDIGGDKKLNYYQFEPEMNPFLGIRAIRFCLQRKDIFRVQLRALLRASAYGKLRVMFPMIATVNEFKEAKQVYEEEKAKLLAENVKIGDDIQVGCMIEIPAAAMIADQLAKYAEFFSIGTNDLIQYSMAADRMSEAVSYLYQPLNPSILREIKMTIDGAHKHNRWCGMCGEMAGDELAAPVLLGLGLDEFSMSATSMLKARKMISHLDSKAMEELANKALELDTEEEVKELIQKNI